MEVRDLLRNINVVPSITGPSQRFVMMIFHWLPSTLRYDISLVNQQVEFHFKWPIIGLFMLGLRPSIFWKESM